MRLVLIFLFFLSLSAGATEPAQVDRDVPADPLAAEPAVTGPAPVVAASDRLELDSTSIRGNQELPRVLTIVSGVTCPSSSAWATAKILKVEPSS